MGLKSFKFLKLYGKLKDIMEISNMVDTHTLSEEEQEIEDLIQSIESAKRKVTNEYIIGDQRRCSLQIQGQ